MNYLNFQNKQSFLNHIKTLSDEDIALQRKTISKLLEVIKYDYNLFRSNLYSTFIFKAKKLSSTEDESNGLYKYQRLLKFSFRYAYKVNKSLNKYEQFNDSSFEDFDFNRDESIKYIKECFEQFCDYYDKLESLSDLVYKQSAIFLYKLNGYCLLNKEYLEQFSNSPKVLFGGLNENGNPDFKYSLEKYIYQIDFDVDFVEGHI